MKSWTGSGGEIADAIEEHASATLRAYEADPELVEEHAKQEGEARTGGYGRRQIFELVQNGADQLDAGAGRLQVVLAEEALYCANGGRPFSPEGLTSILHAYLSRKEDDQIGRFGLGFKSVLGVTSRPMVLSRSGSFGFSPEIASRIRDAVQSAKDVPILRIAGSIDPDEVMARDGIAAELGEWASTIVMLPFDEGIADAPWLTAGIRNFPRPFLVFADQVESLVLEDRSAGLKRSVTAERSGDTTTVKEGEGEESWQVFDSEVSLDEDARARAGKLGDRNLVGVKWAVQPEGSRSSLGEFWSYFPTDDETTLRGVVNAPWQMSEDRRRLVDGPYNEALLEGVAELVLDSIESLREVSGDQTSYLELLPARGREPRCWADGQVTDRTNELVRFRPSVPLLCGDLGLPSEARLHPAEMPEAALRVWASVADPGLWVDHGVELQKDRRARVERYLADAGQITASVEDWLGAAISEPSVEDGIALAVLAAAVRPVTDDGLRELAFVLTDAMELVPPGTPGLMLPGDYRTDDASVIFVHSDVASDPRACSALESFGIKPISAEVELRRIVAEVVSTGETDWEQFWQVARQVPHEDTASAFGSMEGFEPCVRTVAGDFRKVIVTLLPGPCVPADGSRDPKVAIDIQWHRDDLRLLRELGCNDGPSIGFDVASEPWYSEYRDACINAFLRRNEPARPSPDAIEIVADSVPVGPLSVLRALGDDGRAAVTEAGLRSLDEPVDWTVRHSSQAKYHAVAFPNPSIWLMREEGLIPTPVGARSVQECVGPGLRVADLTPAPSCTEAVAAALGLPTAWSEVNEELIGECLERARDSDPAVAALLYSALADEPEVAPPGAIRAIQSGSPTITPREEVAVTADDRVFELLASGTEAVIAVAEDEAVRSLVEHWGLKDGAGLVTRRVAVAAEVDPVVLIDEFPPLRRRLDPALRGIELHRCEEIRIIEEIVGGTRSVDTEFTRDGDRLYCLSGMDQSQVLRCVSRELGLELSADDVARVIRGTEDRRTRELEREVRGMDSDAARLARLTGPEDLEAELPRAARDAFVELYGDPTPEQLGELAISVHGTDTLRVYTDALEGRGLNPPSAWRGGHRAKEFVRNLGFAMELAGFPSDRRSPEIVVEGRPRLPPLHDYQRRIVEELCTLFEDKKKNRAMLTLPTGSGKTRVAIEGCVDGLARELIEPGLILWIAQSDELCEQAVQAWSELWRARELEERLTISRLWGSNKADCAPSGFQVIVATVQKLQGVVDSEDYVWLSRPGAVVVDEAHGSITKIYTRALEWLGLDRSKFGAPLVGLSATPYRGRNKEETRRLASRYGNRRLDVTVLGEGDHYPRLQEEGVISRVRHEILEGSDITLSDAQREDVVAKGLLPTEAGTRLGEDVGRTRTVLEHISGLPTDWPVLVFAPSVENAQALAGLLNHRGVSAATISGETPYEARRWHLRRFRDGDLRVITNYNVLAEGFDAPSVRAVYIARPVFAPNRYQQMVGRGLRGPKNGGKEECLIVDVEDNIKNLEELLAFRSFEYLWDGDLVGSTDG